MLGGYVSIRSDAGGDSAQWRRVREIWNAGMGMPEVLWMNESGGMAGRVRSGRNVFGGGERALMMWDLVGVKFPSVKKDSIDENQIISIISIVS